MRKPEVMSPAGHWPQMEAAIEAGADSVYFGLRHFSARAKVGFSLAELPEAMRTLHERGVRGYLTFNTLVFEHELKEASRTIAAIAESGVDALIVQDYGILRLARQIAPDLELHASTQMSITNAEGVRLAQSFGVQRVTLARELSLDETAAIIRQTGCDVEIFVHGALCVAYSGQCFSSEAWGGRSANRGQCAQACRMEYDILVDGVVRPLADARYLLSPGDLSALSEVPKIIEIGVAALKIEGRYKDAEYVAITTRAYRRAVDGAILTAEEKLQLEQVYSRGLGPYFVTGTDHQKVVTGRAPRHRGVRMGRVTRVGPEGVHVEPSEAEEVAPLKPGDGLVFDAADWRSPAEPEEGGRVYQVRPGLDGALELRFGNGALQFSRIRPGDLVWRTHDPDLAHIARRYTEANAPVTRQPVRVMVIAYEGQPLATTWQLVKHPEIQVSIASAVPLGRAHNHAISVPGIYEQLGRLGNTAYELTDVELATDGASFARASVLNQLRREAVERLRALQCEQRPVTVHEPSLRTLAAPSAPLVPQIHLLVRTPEQLEAALVVHPHSITLDYLDLYGLRPSIERIKAAGIPARVATPRVLKPGEARILDFLVSLDCAILVRAAGLLDVLRAKQHAELIGDFSLNTANSIAAETYFSLGLDRITPGYDLNAAQVADLARDAGAARMEAVAYQHLPVFHTEHCVFCRFLSTGTSYKDCGRPCEEHRVALRDHSGRSHPVMADVGCRNTVFGAEAQHAAAHLHLWRTVGINHFRLEFVHESGTEVDLVFRAFEEALNGGINAHQLTAELKRAAPEGITEGSFYVPAGYDQLPILQ